MEMRTPQRIIGGMFGLADKLSASSSTLPFADSQNIFLANARSGIKLLIELLAPPKIWLPSYLCSSMLEAIDQRSTVEFYEMTLELEVASVEWTAHIEQGDLVIFIDYFGFPYDSSCAARAKEQGAWILEDACQALLMKEIDLPSDFVLFSPRKFVGVPDGGILKLNHNIDLREVEFKCAPAEWWLDAFYATVLRREFDLYGGSRRWFELFQKSEAEMPIGRYAMSELSRRVLTHCGDYSDVAKKRVDNYHVLAAKLSRLALFPTLNENVVPLGFPIRVPDRDRVRQALFDHEIYPAIHWPIEGMVPKKFANSHQLASEIMTLPCDQRYDTNDMALMADRLLQAIR